jgi:ABC-type sugar transport system ATPase subunit
VLKDIDVSVSNFRLHRISFSLRRGDYLFLSGPSGCGKTTLLKAIAGICRVSGGTVHINGRDFTYIPPEKRRIGYVPQNACLFPHYNVRKNILFGLPYSPFKRSSYNQRLERVAHSAGVLHLLKRNCTTLSGGECKRVALARCLILDPPIILLDEPFSMLDDRARSELSEQIQAIHRKRKTLFIHVTHRRDEMEQNANFFGELADGRFTLTTIKNSKQGTVITGSL